MNVGQLQLLAAQAQHPPNRVLAEARIDLRSRSRFG